MSNMKNMTQTTTTPAVHHGPCRVDLDIRIGSTGLTPRALADRALIWADGLDEFDGILPLAREALAAGRGVVEMDREHFDALVEVVIEFGRYAEVCGYDTDYDDEDRLIAQVMIGDTTSRRVSTWLLCEQPVTWTETVTFCRYGEPRSETREHRASAHS